MLLKSRNAIPRMEFEISHSENHFLNSESWSENTPELSESSENGLFTPRAFFLKLGWSPGFWLTAWPEILHYSNYFSLELISALHSLYRKYLSAEIILLYVTLSWPPPLSCTSFFVLTILHYKFRKGITFAMHYIVVTLKNCFQHLKCNHVRSTGLGFRVNPGFRALY